MQSATLSTRFDLLPVGTNIDLTAEGKLDWGHWGYYTETTYNHKYGLAPQISYRPMVDSIYDGPYWQRSTGDACCWTDGTPTPAVANTPHGIFFIGTNHGVQITCPADTCLKTLKLYVGTTGARSRFTADLSGGSVPGCTNTAYANPGAGSNAVFSVDFQAESAGETLTTTFTMDADLSAGGGSVTLQAATLTSTSLPPTVALTSPADHAVFTAPANIDLAAIAIDGAGSVTNLQILSGAIPLGQSTGNALGLTLTNQAADTYVFAASATDSRGLSVTSSPVTVYVTTGGGTLTGSLGTPPTSLDLTAEGQYDWAHWGLVSTNSFDHKANVTPQIPDVVPLVSRERDLNQYSDNLTGYAWSDGTPTLAATNSTTGIFTYGSGNGFELTVPAATTPRRLKVYVGLYGAQGQFEARLSDDSGPPYTDNSLASAYGNAYAVYTLTFASCSPSANLVIRWTSAELFDPTYGNVTWQAATLAPGPGLCCASNLTVASGDPWDFTPPAASGFCDSNVTVAVVSTITNLGCGAGLVATRTWQAADSCGYTAACCQTVTVVDTNPPVLQLVLPPLPGSLAFRFCTQPNRNYAVQSSDSFLPGSWLPLTNLPGNGAEAFVTLSNAQTGARFFRLQVE